MKKMIAVALVFVSVNGFATERFLAKSVTPTRIVLAKDGVGLAQFSVMSRDFPERHVFLAPKSLKSISWESTYYPDNLNETEKICYFQALSIRPDHCKVIQKNSSGSTEEFNSFIFDRHASVMIKHEVKGGKDRGAPAGMDKIVIHYSY
jgi:hypothetical protein